MLTKDLRTNKDVELGDTMEISGDGSMLFITTDKGYMLILDSYNAHRIIEYYKSTERKVATNSPPRS